MPIRRATLRILTPWLALVVACGGNEVGALDAGTGPDAPSPGDGAPPDGRASFTPPELPWRADERPPIAEPVIPWLERGEPPVAAPALGPCPEGWTEVTDDDGTVCRPGAAVEAAPCAAPDEARFASEASCARVGRACPAGSWADDLPTDRPVLFVLAGAGAGGDGTRERPFATIAEGLGATPAGGVVAIGKGTYDETVRLFPNRTLAGACAAETVLTSSSPARDVGVLAATRVRGSMEVRDLRIADAERPGLSVDGADVELVVRGVVVDGVETVGVVVLRGVLRATDFTVRDVRSEPTTRSAGYALVAEVGGRIELERASLERARSVAALVDGEGSRLTLTDVAVLDTQPQELDDELGRGVSVSDRGSIELSRVAIVRSRETAVFVDGTGTAAMLADVVLRDTMPEVSDAGFGRALDLRLGAFGRVERVTVERAYDGAIVVTGTGTVLELEDAVLRDVESRADDGHIGRGLGVESGGRATVARVHIARTHEAGVVVRGTEGFEPPVVTIEDLAVSDTAVEVASNELGESIHVARGATLELRRARLSGSRAEGLLVTEGAAVHLEDVLIRDVLGLDGAEPDGMGIDVEAASALDGSRVVVERSLEQAITALDVGTFVELQDVVLRDARGSRSGRGQGATALRGAQLSLARAVLERNRDQGLAALGAGTRVTLTDVVVRDTRSRPDGDNGYGLSVQQGAELSVERVLVERSHAFGVFAGGSDVRLFARDLAVIDTQASDLDGTLGRGIQVERYADADLERILVLRSHEWGVVGYVATVAMRDVVIADTRGQAADETQLGIGLSAAQGAQVSLSRFSIGDSTLCGVQLTALAEVDLEDGEVFGSQVGACVQIDDYDFARLSSRVLYHDNGVNLQATSHPGPSPVELSTGG